MLGEHAKSVERAKARLYVAANEFAECRAHANKEALRIAMERLQEVSDRAIFPVSCCPYCTKPTKERSALSRSTNWSCDCFNCDGE